MGREDGPTIRRGNAKEGCLNIDPQSQLSGYKHAKVRQRQGDQAVCVA
jgi:hypothetical protein